MLFEHIIKQLSHAFGWLQLKNSLRFLFLFYLLSFLFRLLIESEPLIDRINIEVLDPLNMLRGVSIRNSVQMFDRGQIFHQILLLFLLLFIFIDNLVILVGLDDTLHPALVTKVGTLCVHYLVTRDKIIHSCSGSYLSVELS